MTYDVDSSPGAGRLARKVLFQGNQLLTRESPFLTLLSAAVPSFLPIHAQIEELSKLAWQVLFDQRATNKQMHGEILYKVASRSLRALSTSYKSLYFKRLQGELTLARGVLPAWSTGFSQS
jgi:hypothetical protein